MGIRDWTELTWQQLKETGFLQWVAVFAGVAEVLLAQANTILLYPAGIIATLLSVFLLFKAGLYAECLLNGYYLVMSAYGWWYWMKKKNRPAVKITRATQQEWIVVSCIAGGGFLFLYLLLDHFTDSTVPLADAWISSTAWAGMWLLAKRKIENWILLNISNFFAIPLLFYKQLPLYALLTVFLFIVAIAGYAKWNRILQNTDNHFQPVKN